MIKNKSGISLVALIITIIVMVILSAILIISSGNTVDEANYAKYTHNLAQVEESIKQRAALARKDFISDDVVPTNAQMYNYIAKGGTSKFEMLEEENLPNYTIIEKSSGIDLPIMRVESTTGMMVEAKYAVNKEGKVFTWPPLSYDDKLYVTGNEIVGNIVDGVIETIEGVTKDNNLIENIIIGGEKIEISQNTDWATLIPEGEIEGKAPVETLISKGKIKIGDKITYEPEKGTFSTTGKDYYTGTTNSTLKTVEDPIEWIVIKADNDELLITPSNTVNNQIAFNGAPGYLNYEKVLNEASRTLYSNSKIGAVARSISLEDLGYTAESSGTKYAYYANGTSLSSVSAPSGYTKKVHQTAATGGSYYGFVSFWEYDSANNKTNKSIGGYSYTYAYPTKTAPVLVTAKNDIVNKQNDEVLNMLNGIMAVATTQIEPIDGCAIGKLCYFYNSKNLTKMAIMSSNGTTGFVTITLNLRPVVSLSSSTVIDGQDSNGAWQISY